MPDSAMPLVPVTLFASAALVLSLWRFVAAGLPSPAHRLFAALMGLYLLQSVLVSLRWGYGAEALRLPAGLVAAAIPALAWVAFRALHGKAPAASALVPVLVGWGSLILWPDLADLTIPASYLGFGLPSSFPRCTTPMPPR